MSLCTDVAGLILRQICNLIEEILQHLFSFHKTHSLDRIRNSNLSLLHSHLFRNILIIFARSIFLPIFNNRFEHSLTISLFYINFILISHFIAHKLIKLKLFLNFHQKHIHISKNYIYLLKNL